MSLTPQTITIDLNPSFSQMQTVHCSQYDDNIRQIEVKLKDGGTDIDVSSYTIYIEGTKPDKKGFSYPLNDIGSVDGNTVTFYVQLQMAAVPGMTRMEILLKDGDDHRIGSANFMLAVERAGLQDDTDVSDSELAPYISGAAQQAQAAANSAAAAEQAKDDAIQAKDDAVQAKESAEQSAESISGLSEQIEQNTEDCRDLKNAVDQISPEIAVGNQLCDTTKGHSSTYFNGTAFVETGTYSCSDYIPVASGKTVYASLNGRNENNIFNIVGLSASKEVVTTTANWTGHLAITDEIAFIVVNCYGGTSISTLMVSYDSVMPYEPYVEPYRLSVQDAEYQAIKYPMSLFESVCGCGDSFTQGACVSSNGTTWNNRPWLKKITDKYGIGYLNCGVGGSTTRSWISATNGLAKVLSENACDLYTLAWGINDMTLTTDYIGTIADITADYTQNPDTFYGNYARIIEQIKAHAPNAKFVMFPIWLYYSTPYEVANAFNNAIEEIAEHYSIPYINIFDDWFFNGSTGYQMVLGHPTALAYAGMAQAIERLISKCIESNTEYFEYASVG